MKSKILYLLIWLITLSSCLNKIVLKSMGAFDEKVVPLQLANTNKQVCFIPMHHIGTRAFYKDVKQKIDSLHSCGFVVFYEGVQLGAVQSRMHADTIVRKYRKIIGFLNRNGYIDTLRGTVNGRKYKFLKQLINQPEGEFIGLDSLLDKNVDAVATNMIADFEQKFGPVNLDSCDFSTKIGDPYKCPKKITKIQKQYFIQTYRNQFLGREIQSSTASKIAVMYGENHFDGLFSVLKSLDSTWMIK